jgi:hypothetical protein
MMQAGFVESESSYSFFNLEAELCIEGLDRAMDCQTYQFHSQRGYGSDYNNEVRRSNNCKHYIVLLQW